MSAAQASGSQNLTLIIVHLVLEISQIKLKFNLRKRQQETCVRKTRQVEVKMKKNKT